MKFTLDDENTMTDADFEATMLRPVVRKLFKDFKLNSSYTFPSGFLYSFVVGPFNMDLIVDREADNPFVMTDAGMHPRSLSRCIRNGTYDYYWDQNMINQFNEELIKFNNAVLELKKELIG